MLKRLTFLSGLFLMSLPHVLANNLTIERLYATPNLSGTEAKQVKLSPDGQRVTFIQAKANDINRYDLWEYHLPSKQTRLLVDADELHRGDEQLSDEERARRERQRVYGSGILDYQWASDANSLLFPLAGSAYHYDLQTKRAKALVQHEDFATDLKFSPQNRYVSFVRAQNLYVVDVATGQETAITTAGGGDRKFAMAEFVAQEEMSRMTGYWWSPNEQYLAYLEVDESPVLTVTRAEIYADHITHIEQKYPKAGTANVRYQLHVYDLHSGQTISVPLPEQTKQDIYIARVKWYPDSQRLAYQQQTRDQQTLHMQVFDLAAKRQTTLLTERSTTWVNLHDDWQFINTQGDFLWGSERDGFHHLYLINGQTGQAQQLTKGSWVTTGIKAFDAQRGVIYFTGRKDTVLENHLYQYDMQSKQTKRISALGFDHHPTFADDASIYVDVFSSVNTPQQMALFSASGEQLTWLNENAITAEHPLSAYQEQWVEPEFGTLQSRDGETLYYRLYKPKNITGKHPVIVYQYGGPHVQVVNNSWGGTRGLMFQYWVQQGYVVFSIDNRGSANRGKAFEEPIYQAMGQIEVHDQIDGVKFLHTLPFVDSKRIGTYGHSYGGYMALMNMFQGADYFAAGVAGAPVTDWRLYDTHYTERYMGDPRQVSEAYDRASVFPYLKNLKGELLVLHGMADDNVLFTHSTMLYQQLQANMLRYHSIDYPGKKHSLRGNETGIHMWKTITHHFDTYLR